MEQFTSREAFDTYWKENYIPLTYEDVREEFENYVKEAEKHIFLSDYEEGGCIAKTDFMDNLSQPAQFTFQDTLTEAFYEKNPDLYETAFAIYEEEQMEGKADQNIAASIHEQYHRLYQEFFNQMFDTFFGA